MDESLSELSTGTNDSTKKLEGVALIKKEFIVEDHVRKLAIECITEKDKRKLEDDTLYFQSNKKQKLRQKSKKWLKGQNKARGPKYTLTKQSRLCSYLVDDTDQDLDGIVHRFPKKCPKENCQYIHDVQEYLREKPADIGSTCYVYSVRGHCPRGISCRFGSQHITPECKNKVDKTLFTNWTNDKKLHTLNSLSNEVQTDLRKRTYNFKKSEVILSEIDKRERTKKGLNNSNEESQEKEKEINSSEENRSGPVEDTDIVKLRLQEKKKINWNNKLYLSPLTTVGNLPFRRICKEFGADVTCGEMALASSLLQMKTQEWALTKRHGSEDLFGVQICGSNPYVMTRCAQVLQEQTEIDFIDINLGCPIDLIYQQGAGSGLLGRKKMLFSIVKCINSVLDLPLTVKTRVGIYNNKNVAHELMSGFSNEGVSLITVHGRSREQRYTKSADWAYIEQCAQLAKPTPVFGNGDIISYTDYEIAKANYPSIAGCMIGRGALIKPWLFTEIKEQRHWDISSSERFDILKKYVNYGLEHWGSDNMGVENTRSFMLEWLSFLHRYIPVGLLETPPQKINERPPVYRGRDELETLMSSSSCSDWVKISEMLLGPVPDGFLFFPKHKANAWK